MAEWEPRAGETARRSLEQALASIALNPALAGRIPSYYEPARPSFLFRSGQVLIHYRMADDGRVEFLNLFFHPI